MIEEKLSFRCKECGSRELYVEHLYCITEAILTTLECTCTNEEEFAAQRMTYLTTGYCDVMDLLEDHRLGPTDETEEIETTEEEGDSEVRCHNCLATCEEDDWTSERESSDVDEDSVEFSVFCAGCDREIEFGWSHPERGGRIWPTESRDFNPWKCWPEPRYRENWLQKGWIRPDFR